MATKIRDIVAKTGEYTDSQGQTKGRYVNVGSLMKGDNGEFIIMHRHFNPAGLPNPENRDSVVLSCFKLDNQQQSQQQSPANQPPPQSQNNGFYDDDIPGF